MEIREPLYTLSEGSPPDSPPDSVVKTSYFFLRKAAFHRVLPAVQKRTKEVHGGARLVFAGRAEDLALAVLCKTPIPLEVTHAIIYVSRSYNDYRMVRRSGDLFFKFFSSCEEAHREATIHKHMFNTFPDKVVPFVDLTPAPQILHNVPNFAFSENEFPLCLVTKAPPEPFIFLSDITDFHEARVAVAKVKDLIEGLYRDLGFVHGDVHGKNVILARDDSVLLLDFGMSEIHNKDLSERLNAEGDSADVAYNNFSDRDVFLHLINDRDNERRVSRAEYMHLYDIGRAIHRGAPRFEARMARHFLPDAKDDPAAKRIKAPDFRNHFFVAHKMINLKYDNLATRRLRFLADKTNSHSQVHARAQAPSDKHKHKHNHARGTTAIRV